ncbi:MAG: hypothetical protein M1819_002485 [Sarea resinae]|nr:MAG: hypothetical protein M1819_002485 [Sarea resinae]
MSHRTNVRLPKRIDRRAHYPNPRSGRSTLLGTTEAPVTYISYGSQEDAKYYKIYDTNLQEDRDYRAILQITKASNHSVIRLNLVNRRGERANRKVKTIAEFYIPDPRQKYSIFVLNEMQSVQIGTTAGPGGNPSRSRKLAKQLWTITLLCDNTSHAAQSAALWKKMKAIFQRMTLQELAYLNLNREGIEDLGPPDFGGHNLRTGIRQGRIVPKEVFELVVPGEPEPWVFPGKLTSPKFLAAMDRLNLNGH